MDDEDLKRVAEAAAEFVANGENPLTAYLTAFPPAVALSLLSRLSAAAERERELLKSGEYWLDRHCDDTAALHAAAERERELVEALNGLVDAIDYRETPEGRRSYAIRGTIPVALHRARALQAKEPT
jgi:predicted deacylase